MSETTTVEMDNEGRLTIPKPTRKALGIEGQAAIIQLNIEVREEKADG
jgi:bifunctional DNA-binding transcriptional regulator/antitoxin component of YhaV-PrlF toxin-antitoxin module